MSEAEVNGRGFLQALMSLKNKCHIKGRLLKHFGWAVLPAPLLPGGCSPSKTADVCIILFWLFFLLFIFPPICLPVWDLLVRNTNL